MNNELIINLYKHLMGLDYIYAHDKTILIFTILIPDHKQGGVYYRKKIKIKIDDKYIHVFYDDAIKGYYHSKYNTVNKSFIPEIIIDNKEYISSAIIARMNMYVKIFNAFRFGYYE